jgi:hypothetical protein
MSNAEKILENEWSSLSMEEAQLESKKNTLKHLSNLPDLRPPSVSQWRDEKVGRGRKAN